MSPVLALDNSVVDVVFPITGHALPRDHAQALKQALCAQWPWLATDAQAAIHPIKLVPGLDALALLSKRSNLLVRVDSPRADALLALAGLDLVVDGHPLHLGSAHRRELQPHATLYAYKVAAESADEVTLMASVAQELAEMGVGGERVCGKRHSMQVAGQVVTTFSLMLHALKPDQSMRLQQRGLGASRLLGCGIFVPHKSAAAV